MNKKRWISCIMAALLLAGVVGNPILSYPVSAEGGAVSSDVQEKISDDTLQEKTEEELLKEKAKTGEENTETDPQEQSTEQSTEQSAEQSSEQSAEQSTKQSAQQSTEQSTEQSAEVNTEIKGSEKIKIVGDKAYIPGWEDTLEAEVLLEGEQLSFQWQVSDNGEDWQDIEGAAERIYQFFVTEEMFSKWYRLCVNDGNQIYTSESIQMKKAVCYTVAAGEDRVTSQVTGHAELKEAFAKHHSSHFDEEINIVLLQDIIVEETIDVGTPRGGTFYTNTYTLKSQQGQTYQISPKNGFKGAMFKMRGDSDASISGDSKVILENVAIQGYPIGQEPVMTNQCDSLFELFNHREPTGNKDDGNTWLEIRGGVKLENPGEPVVKLVHEIQSNAVTINAKGQDPITIKGEIEVPGARNMIHVQGSTANLTQDSDVVFALDYYATEGGWGAVENRWLMQYSEAVNPTEAAYFRLKNPDKYWIVAKGGKESSLQIHSNRPDTIYLGSVLADGKTVQNDIYAEGVFPGSVNGGTSQSAVSALDVAYAKIRQLNLDETAPKADLAIVSETVLDGSYQISETGFSGGGYSWSWKQPAEIHRYYRPQGKTASDAGYQDENYKGVLFRVKAGADCTLENLVLNGKPETTASSADAQAPMFAVDNQGRLTARSAALINNRNMADNAKGGAVYLADGANLQTENVTITGNRVHTNGHGAGVYQENGAVFGISGSYTTEDTQQVWLSDSAKITVTGSFTVTGVSAIPIDFTSYIIGRLVAEYAEGLPSPDLNEVEKFRADQTKLFEKGLYLENTERTIVLAERTGGLSFGFTKQDKNGKPIANTIFRLYKCKNPGAEGHTHSRLADLYQSSEDNCWTQISQQKSNAEGILNFGFLKDGEYRLAEYRAPYGYEVPEGQWKVTIKTVARMDEKIVLEYISKNGEKDPGSKIVLDQQDGTDAKQSYIRNNDAVLTDFSFKVETSDQGKPATGIVFEFYSCEHWKNPQHTHEELATPECVENGGCWIDYDRGANKDGQYVSGSRDGIVRIGKLMDGDYMLKQVTAVNGYELPTGQWLIRVRHDEENPITMIGKGEHTGDNFQIGYDSATGKFDYILTNRLLVEPGHEKYVKYNEKSGDYTLTLDVTGKQRVAQISENPVSVVLIVDTIGGNQPTQNFERVQDTARAIIEKVLAVDSENEVAVVDMNGSHDNLTAGTYDDAWVQETGLGKTWTNNKEDALGAVNSLQRKIGTGGSDLERISYASNWQAGFLTAQDLFNGKKGTPKEKNDRIIVFLPAGKATYCYNDNGITQQVSTPRPYYDKALPEIKKLLQMSGKNKTTLKVVSVTKYVKNGVMGGDKENQISGTTPMLNEDITKAGFNSESWLIYNDYQNTFNEKELQALVDSFNAYEPKYFLQKNVTVTDTLSEYAELAADKWDGNYTLEAVKADGSPGAIPEGTTASWDADAKKVTLTFPQDFELENGTTYKISFNIRPTEKAYKDFIGQGLTYGKAVGDWGTDAPGNKTSSGQPGFFCNTEATVTYDFGNQTGAVCKYRRPVIQVAYGEVGIFFYKVGSLPDGLTDDNPSMDDPTVQELERLAGAEFKLYMCLNKDPNHVHETLASEDSKQKGCWTPIQEAGKDKIYISQSSQPGADPEMPGELQDPLGKVDLGTLPMGEDMLEEVKAPQGYVTPKDVQWKLTIGEGESSQYSYGFERQGEGPDMVFASIGPDAVGEYVLPNKKEPAEPMPEAGGAGTSNIYGLGIILLAVFVMSLRLWKKEESNS